MEIAIQIKNLNETKARMQKRGQSFRTGLSSTMLKAVNYIHGQLPPESSVPEPPGSTYHRTGTMVRELTTAVRPLGSSVVGVLGAPTIYAPHVIDQARQAKVHRGRWWTLQGEVNKRINRAIQIFQDWIQQVLKET